jgi:ubiquinone/menaquinone biosynthesis C-methylase UbiE
MPADSSLWFYGRVYHLLFDRPLAEGRRRAAELVPPSAKVLDIACGTGELCAALARAGCQVVGVDLSLRMLRFAAARHHAEGVSYRHLDATDLGAFADCSFDVATALFLVHELDRERQLRVLGEAARVARRVILADAAAPLPANPHAFGIRLVEATFGHDHHRQFLDFLAGNGIAGILEAAHLPLAVTRQTRFWHGCRELVELSH